jgi:hypothetical protein
MPIVQRIAILATKPMMSRIRPRMIIKNLPIQQMNLGLLLTAQGKRFQTFPQLII